MQFRPLRTAGCGRFRVLARRRSGCSAVPSPSVPALEIAVIALGTLILANLAAVVPGRLAARTPAALVLEAEYVPRAE